MSNTSAGASLSALERELAGLSRKLDTAQHEIEKGIKSELGPAVRALGSSLTEVKEVLLKVCGVARETVQVNERGFKLVNDSVNAVVQSAGETEILIRTADIRSLRAQLVILEKSIADLRQSLRESADELRVRYRKLLEDVIGRREQRLNELERHVLDLVEREFLQDIEGRQRRFRTFDDLARQHLAHVLSYRGMVLDADLADEIEGIEQFMRRQQELDAVLDSVRRGGPAADGLLGAPVLVVEPPQAAAATSAALLVRRDGAEVAVDAVLPPAAQAAIAGAAREGAPAEVRLEPAERDAVRGVLERWRAGGRITAEVHEAASRCLDEAPPRLAGPWGG